MKERLLCSYCPFCPSSPVLKGWVLFLSLYFPLFHDPFKGSGVSAGSWFAAHSAMLHAVTLQSISSSCSTNWQQANDWDLFPRENAEGMQQEAIADWALGLIWLNETETSFQSQIQFATLNTACGVKQNHFSSVFLQPSRKGRQYHCCVSLSKSCHG